jgi:SHS2 domain-containing protein
MNADATGFEILEHPADIGFRVRGRSAEELFARAALAMLSIAGELENIVPREAYDIEATGADYESLLVNWLSEVLWLYDGRRLALAEFRIESLTEEAVRATACGERRDSARHRARLVVKAVTYHQLRVERGADGWLAEVYLDI